MINIVAVISAKPGKRAEILAAFRAYLPTVLAEDGCIEYTALIDTEGVNRIQTPIGTDTFMVIEKWSNLEALKAHAVSANTATFSARIDPWLLSRVIHVLSPA